MAKVAKENWVEKIRDPKIECMSREDMKALQSEKLVKQVKHVYDNVEYYRNLMDEKGVKPEDIHGIEDLHLLPFLTKAVQQLANHIHHDSVWKSGKLTIVPDPTVSPLSEFSMTAKQS